MVKKITLLTILTVMTSCSSLRNFAKYELKDGEYTSYINNKKSVVFVDNEEDTVKVKINDSISVFPIKTKTKINFNNRITKTTLDLDLLSSLVKLRPKQKSVPVQLNTNISGNLFIGVRKDVYSLHYSKNDFNTYNRKIRHLGFSFGAFLGLGNTLISPTTTDNIYDGEYDGVVLQKGIAGTVAIDKFTLGLGLGFDNLLGGNKNIWIYQHKPWLGLMLGLNLN